MKLTYFQSTPTNFGDELNKYLWRNLVGYDFFDEDDNTLFLGVGSILWDHYPNSAKKVVMGSGYGGYTNAPNVNDGNWDIRFVRGPRTAKQLNIPLSKVITDSAILTRFIDLPEQPVFDANKKRIGFMPHYQSIARASWEDVCELSGIMYLDPTEPDVLLTLSKIANCDFIISEAMHGVILADTLRVPWIPIQPKVKLHRNKWYDWAESMKIDLNFNSCPNTSLLDFWSSISGLQASGSRSISVKEKLKLVNSVFIHNGAKALSKFKIEDAYLSSDSNFEINSYNALQELNNYCNDKKAL